MSKYYRHEDIIDMIEQGFSIDTDEDKAYVIHELLPSLPTIEVSNRTGDWIPVSSGNLPKNRERVFFSMRLPGNKYGIYISDGQYVKEYWKDKHITAWQPLPAPYEESEDI